MRIQVLLRDPLDENVVPVIEELQRRLPPVNAISNDHRDGQNDVDAGEEDGILLCFSSFVFIRNMYLGLLRKEKLCFCELQCVFWSLHAESPFEFRALEVALEAICSFLAARTTELETAAYPALDELTSKV